MHLSPPPNRTEFFLPSDPRKFSPPWQRWLDDARSRLNTHDTLLSDWGINVKDPQYGAIGDGVTDDTVALQRALDAIDSTGGVFNGGFIYVPPGLYKHTGLSVKENTTIRGAAWAMTAATPRPASVLYCSVSGPGLVPYDSTSFGVCIEKLGFQGNALSGSRHIYVSGSAKSWIMRDLWFDESGDEAVKIASGVGGEFHNLFAQNGLMVRTGRAAYIGVIDLGCTDAWLINVQSTASIGSGTGNIGGGFIAGIVNRGTNSWLLGCTGHLSQVGIVTTGDVIRVIGNRADLNQGNGFVNTGGRNKFSDNVSYSNSRTANAGYAGFKNTEANSAFSDNFSVDEEGDAVRMLYGFEDTASASGGVKKAVNRYNFNRVLNQTGAEYSFSGATLKVWTGYDGDVLTTSGPIEVGTATEDITAIANFVSTTRGVLFPRMTTTQQNAIASPPDGLVIFNTTTGKLRVVTGGAWADLH